METFRFNGLLFAAGDRLTRMRTSSHHEKDWRDGDCHGQTTSSLSIHELRAAGDTG